MRRLVLASSHQWQIALMLSPLLAGPTPCPVLLCGQDTLSLDTRTIAAEIAANFNRYYLATEVTTVGQWDPGNSGLGDLSQRAIDDDPWTLLSFVQEHLTHVARVVLFPPDRPDLAYATALLAADGETILFPDLGPNTGEELQRRTGVTEILTPGADRHQRGVDAAYIAALLGQHNGALDYIILTNSQDLVRRAEDPDLGALWIPKISLAAPLLAAGRNALILDIDSAAPDAMAIERQLNALVETLGLRPRYLAFVGSPGSLPPIRRQIELPKIKTTWEIGREPYIRLNGDLYHDLAYGRITGLSCYDAAALVVRSLCYAQMDGDWQRQAYFISNAPGKPNTLLPFFETEARILDEQLQAAGFETRADHFEQATVAAAQEGMPGAGLIFGSVHGLYTGWMLKDRTLRPIDIPELAPAFIWTYSCTTARLAGNLPRGFGVNLPREPVTADQAVSLGFIRQGAIGYIGGTSGEDHQHSGPMAKSVMDRMIFDGMSAGEALTAAKNRQIALDAVVRQTDPDLARRKRWTYELTLAQWELYGDPAWRPKLDHRYAPDDLQIECTGSRQQLTVTFPQTWHKASAIGWRSGDRAVNHTVRHPKIKHLTWRQPTGPVEMWGSYLPIAPTLDGLAKTALGSGYAIYAVKLPEGMQPVSLRVAACSPLDASCTCCGAPKEIDLPYVERLLQEINFPLFLTLDHVLLRRQATGAWPFDLDDNGNLWFVAPCALIDDEEKCFVRLQSLTLDLELAPSANLQGVLVDDDGSPLANVHIKATDRAGIELHDTLTDAAGRFQLKVPAGQGSLSVGDISHTYTVACEGRTPWQENELRAYHVTAGQTCNLGAIEVSRRPGGVLSLTLFAGADLERMANAEIRIFDMDSAGAQEDYRGALAFAGHSDDQGRLVASLPEGQYSLWAYARHGDTLWRGHREPCTITSQAHLHINLEMVAG